MIFKKTKLNETFDFKRSIFGLWFSFNFVLFSQNQNKICKISFLVLWKINKIQMYWDCFQIQKISLFFKKISFSPFDFLFFFFFFLYSLLKNVFSKIFFVLLIFQLPDWKTISTFFWIVIWISFCNFNFIHNYIFKMINIKHKHFIWLVINNLTPHFLFFKSKKNS